MLTVVALAHTGKAVSSYRHIYALHGQHLSDTIIDSRVCFILPHHCASLSMANLFCDRSPDLRSHVLNCWEYKETGRKLKNILAFKPIT